MKAVAVVPKSVLKSRIKGWVDQKVQAKGGTVEWIDVSENPIGFREVLRKNKNVIAWNCRLPHKSMVEDGGNTLFVDNSLISQRAGVFIDNRGFFSNSNLCVQQTWKKPSFAHLEFIAKRDFGWEAFSGGDADGPILVALQLREDCNVKLEFPLAANAEDKVVESLKILKSHLPRGREILVRPHPREWKNFSSNGVWRDDWTMNTEGKFSEILPKCCALVTVNSTCVSEAALLGVPTATLGVGAFSGSGLTLDCSKDPKNLNLLGSFKPDLDLCRRYCAAIINHHFLPYDIHDGRVVAEFESWLAHATS